jgi:flagellar biogenesis protein FliO
MKGVDLSGAWKVLWGTLGIGGLAIAAALVWRKHGSRTWRAAAGEGLQVLGRAALSPRHHVFVVRFGDRKVLVGVSGDRMASLAVVEEGSPSGPRLEAAMTERGGPDRGAVEREIGCSRRTVSEADLVPYRRQVDRLRDLLRGRPPMGSAGREE